MRSREQVIWDFVQSWLAKAEGDLHAARVLLSESGEFGEAIGFHSQRAAEKFMKAYLVRHQVEFRKTHQLALLRKLISRLDGKLAEQLAFADWLSPFGVEARCPGETPEVDHPTAQKAALHADEVRTLVLASLKEYIQRGRPNSNEN